jgi:hypothetical protein
MVDAQTISIIFAGVSIGVAAIYYTLTLRNTQRAQKLQLETRQAQMFLTLFNRMLDENFAKTQRDVQWVWEWSDFEDFMVKYGPSSSENWAKFTITMMFFEGIGILVNKGIISASLIDDFISAMTIRIWNKYRRIIYDMREHYNAPQTYEWVEYLYNEIKPITEEQHPELKT